MRKVLLSAIVALAALTSTLSADGYEINGVIGGIDNNAKTITVNGIIIQVLPQTRIELDDCGIFGMDLNGKFVDLAIGSFVEVEAWPNQVVQNQTNVSVPNTQASYIASEITLECVSTRAY